MKQNRPIHIYIWNDPENGTRVILHSMEHKEKYDATQNAQNVAKLFMMTLPGNTVDILLDAIEQEIRPMLESPDSIDILKSKYDIQNRVRCALNSLISE